MGLAQYVPFKEMESMKRTLLAATLACMGSSYAADLAFNPATAYTEQSTQVNGQRVDYRAYEGIVYVRKPVDAAYQQLNVYIPAAYFKGGKINGFTAETAPIFLPNQIGGYMPAKPGQPGLDKRAGNTPNAMLVALSKGYVVVSPGARGRTQQHGKAPAAIVDLKAAVRYLRLNDARMPGNAEKIISNGTSAGGALSVLLGASGNSADYAPHLRALGAADARDDIFAVSAYCPISILEHADAAYEWQFNGVNDYQKIQITQIDYNVERQLIKGTQTPVQQKLSDALKPEFPAYVNALGLKNAAGQALTLDEKGNGSFKNHVAGYLVQSAQKALDAGKDLSAQSWLTIRDGKVLAADFDAYARFVGRQKTAPAFDDVALGSGENQLFGTEQIDKQHFTAFGMAHSTAKDATRADAHTVRLMNPMHYIGLSHNAPHWRIRVGTNDRDTSLAIATILATEIANSGKQVDFAMPWGVPHSGDYDLDELFVWMDGISR